MLDILTVHTNRYALRHKAGSGRPWIDVTQSELECFIGICLYMGIYSCPNVEDYWSTDPYTPSFFFTTRMTLLRFQQIKRYLHVCDVDADNGKSSFFNKVEPLFPHFTAVSRRLWTPSSYVSCDEMMVMNHGRSSETVRMKNKPIACGFNIWGVCDSGYIFYAFPHSNRSPWRHCETYRSVLPHSSAVVARLVESLPRTMPYSKSKESKMYAVFMDNLFSTPNLFKLLREKDIAAVGTVRSNEKGFPKSLAVRGGPDKKMNWNTLGAALCADGKVLALTWIDNGAVQMLTTLHRVGPDETVERARKRPRLTSTNGKRVREIFGDQPVKPLPIPRVVDDYNFNMGGVDIADQLRSSYTCHLTSFRTWMPLFFWLIDSATSNSYLILSGLNDKWIGRHREFRLELACSLIREGSRRVDERRCVSKSTTTEKNDKLKSMAMSGGYVTKMSFW